ncbi:MAG: ABC transporter substrate-binding protein [Alphaproteobacteria bacterium]|nr:ABC transporter substrate-binding protein [Alphaproteobacteria bacterium]
MWSAIQAFLRTYGLVVGIVMAAVTYVAWGFVAPPPPTSLRLASGPEDGAYHATALRYRELLARHGVTVEVVPTVGSLANIAELERDTGNAHIALVQGGVARAAEHPFLVSLGSVFLEPLWVFARAGLGAARLGDLHGRRVAVGPEGSGTRALALQLLAANGVPAEGFTPIPVTGQAAAAALADGSIDAALFVNASATPAIVSLLRAPGVVLLDFAERAEAHKAAFPFLSAVPLHAGAVSLADDLPRETVTLLAPAAQLAAREDIHPKLVTLLMRVLPEVHASRQLFSGAASFPTTQFLDFPLHEDAQRWYEQGPSFLQRWLPFWVAVWVERMMVLLIPLLTLAIPLLRIAPPAFRWQVERKIYRWYKDIRELEAAARRADTAAAREALAPRIERIEGQVSQLKVPISYGEQLYNLRLHIEFVRRLLHDKEHGLASESRPLPPRPEPGR